MFKSRDGKTMRKRNFGLWGEWADFSLKLTAQLKQKKWKGVGLDNAQPILAKNSLRGIFLNLRTYII